jgi:hypothetical protein
LVVTQGGSLGYTICDETFDRPVPELTITLTVTSSEGVTAGQLSNARAEVVGFRVASQGAEDDSVEYMHDLLKGLPGTVDFTLDQYRRLVGAAPALPAGEPGELLVLGYVDRRLTTLADPLPSEPFGVGAVWEARRSATIEGFPVDIVDWYTATVVSSSEVRANLRRSIHFRPGEYEGGEILEDSVLSGSGEVVWDGGGFVGAVNYDLSGSVRYRLTSRTALVQDINRTISTTSELSVPAAPDPPAEEPAPTTETTPATDPPAEEPPAEEPPAEEPPADEVPNDSQQSAGSPDAAPVDG